MNDAPQDDAPAPLAPGLYLVGTPIGNLEDITLRALRVLRSCDLVAAEDTRRIRKLLNYFEISVKTISYREQNQAEATPKIIDSILRDNAVALVSDAGMPAISDPGAELVVACEEAGLAVHVIPGPTAAATAVSRAGFSGDRFAFLGFPPSKKGQRSTFYAGYSTWPDPLVFYEAPHRIVKSLEDAQAVLGNRQIRLMRELTKMHEEILRGSTEEVLTELRNREEIRGEITVVVAPAVELNTLEMDFEQIEGRYKRLIAEGVRPADALKLLSAESGRRKRELYRLLRIES